jgi:16S rRNA (guanine966-N2)-methyltransferase
MAAGGPKLRVVAGEFGGRRLRSPGGDVRPSAERTREAIFSMLGPLSGSVLDLYCGSGALGLEALSRGAEGATFVDRDVTTVRDNVEALAVGDRCTLIRADLPRGLEPGGPLSGERFGLVLCDPPYRLADRLGPQLDKLLPGLLAQSGILIVESPASSPIRLSLPLRSERRYGAAHVGIYEAPAAERGEA